MQDLIQIAGIEIKQDSKGRYCLNDLHKASGDKNKDRPSLWLENSKSKELVKLCSKAGFPALSSRQKTGTYAVKELVYAYAMWISPEFQLHVIQTYDKHVNEQHNWENKRIDASAQFKAMEAILQEARKLQGKETNHYHFSNEARLINWALKGKFSGLDRESLSSNELKILALLERRNAVLIGIGMSYDLRKSALKEYVETLKQPGLAVA